MKKAKLILAISTMIVFLAACSKDGETGPQGQAGANGTNGNANVTPSIFKVQNWGLMEVHTMRPFTQFQG